MRGTNSNQFPDLKLFDAEEPSDFLEDFAREKDDPTFADATLLCQDEEIPCHRFVLGAKSEVFKKMFSSKNFLEGIISSLIGCSFMTSLFFLSVTLL